MSGKFIRNWAILSVVWFALALLWHAVLFGTQYGVQLLDIGRYVDGTPTPLMFYFILTWVMVAFAFAMYLPVAVKGKYIAGGAVMGLVTVGTFAVLSHALFAGWSSWLMSMDLIFAVAGGIIAGWVTGKLS